MGKFKTVSMEPTAEMVEAAEEAYMPFGDMDLAIRMALLAAPTVQGEPVVHTFYVLHDATKGQKYIKKDVDDGCLAIFEEEEDAQWAKRRHPGTEYKRVDYYTAPQPAPDVAKLAARLSKVIGDLESGFVACERCGDQEDTATLDCVPELTAIRNALAAHCKGEEV